MKQIKQIKINARVILALNLNEDLKENYLKFYKDFEGSLEEFLKLEEISFYDKVSVAVRLIDTNTSIKFSMKCAEYVLPIFEEIFQDDKRIRNCIEFSKSIDDFENLNDDQLKLLNFYTQKSRFLSCNINIKDIVYNDLSYSVCESYRAICNAISFMTDLAYVSDANVVVDFLDSIESLASSEYDSTFDKSFSASSTILQFLIDLIK